jgi:mono/diheme cytochrome c family protein
MSHLIPRALVAVFVAGLWACNNGNLPVAPSTPNAAAAGTVSFKTDVAPLLAATCAGCHAAGQEGERDLLLFVNGQVDYSAASGHIAKIVRETTRGDMPQGRAKLTTAQLAILQAWSAAGTPNN